jgi:peptidyl-prolyl cis-trans isomerase B (cyclophilin B)
VTREPAVYERGLKTMRSHRLLIITSAALVLGLAGVAVSSATQAASHHAGRPAAAAATASSAMLPSTGKPRPYGKADASNPCGFQNAVPMDRYRGLPDYTAAAAAQPYTAELYTTQGEISFRALTSAAPCTTFSFRFLASSGYFNGTHCHRLTILQIFVLQCGDPTGTGSGGPGYVFENENLTGATYPAGTVAMANAGPDTNGSQFFFCWANSSKIPPDYTPFGVVTSGMNVLRTIASAGDDSQNAPGDGYPNLYVAFQRVRIVTGS